MSSVRRKLDNPNFRGSRRLCANGFKLKKLNRIPEVIKRECISPRTLAARMEMTTSQVMANIDSTKDLKLSELYRWQRALRVPIGELMAEVDTSLSAPVALRAQLLRAMRTVRSIQETASQEGVQNLAQQLAEQMTNLMPELKEVTSWPTVGQQRTLNELGAIVDRVLPEHHLQNPSLDPNE